MKISWLFFFPNGSPEWTQCLGMGPPATRELYSIFKAVITKLSEYSVYSSEWSERARDNCLCLPAIASRSGEAGGCVCGYTYYNK
jgi:hypothetical protein